MRAEIYAWRETLSSAAMLNFRKSTLVCSFIHTAVPSRARYASSVAEGVALPNWNPS